jgi:hypothetical protein
MKPTFLLQIDLSGIINYNTFSVVPSIINENAKNALFHCVVLMARGGASTRNDTKYNNTDHRSSRVGNALSKTTSPFSVMPSVIMLIVILQSVAEHQLAIYSVRDFQFLRWENFIISKSQYHKQILMSFFYHR